MKRRAYSAFTVTQTRYTIRGVPPRLDQELRRKAREEQRSLNVMALRAMERGLGLAEEEPRYHDLDDLAGTCVDDPERTTVNRKISFYIPTL